MLSVSYRTGAFDQNPIRTGIMVLNVFPGQEHRDNLSCLLSMQGQITTINLKYNPLIVHELKLYITFDYRSANLVLNLFSLMVDANIPDIVLEPDKTVKKVNYHQNRLIVFPSHVILRKCVFGKEN